MFSYVFWATVGEQGQVHRDSNYALAFNITILTNIFIKIVLTNNVHFIRQFQFMNRR